MTNRGFLSSGYFPSAQGAFFAIKTLQKRAQIRYNKLCMQSQRKVESNMTFAKICLAVLVCIPLAIVIYFFLKKLVDEIR